MNTTHLHRALVLALAAPLALSACGGGGASMVRNSTPPPIQPSATPPPVDPLGPCPTPTAGNCIVTTYGTMLGGRDSANALRVQLPTGQDLRLGSSDPSVGGDSLRKATYRFASGTVVEHGGLLVDSGNTLRSNLSVQREGYAGIRGSAVGNLDNEGIVEVFGNMTGMVANRGRLYLLGDIHGDVRNEALFDVDASSWNGVTATIAGNYAALPSSTLAIALCPDGWDCTSGLSVSGRAEIAGALQLRQYTDAWGPYALPGNGTHRILHADGGVFGTFDHWTSPGLFVEGNLRYGGNDVWFDLTRISLQAAMAGQGFGGITAASAGNLDRALGVADGFGSRLAPLTASQSRFLQSAGRLLWLDDAGQAARSLDSLAGTEHAAFGSDAQTRAGEAAGQLALQAGLRRIDGQPSHWSLPLASGRMDGYDQWLGPNTLLGGSFATDASANATTRSDDRRASLYLHQRGTSWQGTLVATAGRSEGLLQRRIDLADGQAHVVGGRRRIDLAQLHAELARPFMLGGGRLQPYAALDAGALRGGGFREQGDTGFELVSNGGALHQVSTALGLRYAREWRIGTERVRLLADLQEAQRLHLGGPWQAAFMGVPDAPFDLRDWSDPHASTAQFSLQGDALHGWQWAISGMHDGRRQAPLSWQLRLAREL